MTNESYASDSDDSQSALGFDPEVALGLPDYLTELALDTMDSIEEARMDASVEEGEEAPPLSIYEHPEVEAARLALRLATKDDGTTGEATALGNETFLERRRRMAKALEAAAQEQRNQDTQQ